MEEYNIFDSNFMNEHLLSEESISIITPASSYIVDNDRRILIPFIKADKIGFANRHGDVVVTPQFDIYYGSIEKEGDFIHVGIRHNYAYERKGSHPQIYTRYKFGLLNYKGECIIEPNYSSIIVGENNFILHKSSPALYDKKMNLLIPYGIYRQLDPFYNGLSRCRDDKKINGKRIETYGIVDENGEVVLDLKERFIWPFYGKYQSHFNSTLNLISNENPDYYKSLKIRLNL